MADGTEAPKLGVLEQALIDAEMVIHNLRARSEQYKAAHAVVGILEAGQDPAPGQLSQTLYVADVPINVPLPEDKTALAGLVHDAVSSLGDDVLVGWGNLLKIAKTADAFCAAAIAASQREAAK